jgi:Tfp pilus assembly protein PilF
LARKPAANSNKSSGGASIAASLQSAVAQHRAGDLASADKIYRDVLKRDGNNADALHLLGLVLHQKEENGQAAELIERAIELKPKQAEYVYNLGKVRAAQEHWSRAVDANRAAIVLKPGYAAAHCNLGLALLWQGRPGAAEASLRDAIKADSASASSWSGLGLALRHQGKNAEAEAAWQKALEFQPDFAEAHYNLATLRLAAMDFVRGWPGFAWRAKADTLSFDSQAAGAHPFSLPQWQGEPLAGKTIFLWGEQGLGDQILFSGLIPDVIEQGAKVVLECEPRLAELLARSFPQVTAVARARPVPSALTNAAFDVQCPLGDLGRFLRPNISAFRGHKGYIRSDPNHTAALRARYHGLGKGKPVVGISWRSPRKRFGALKSTDLIEDWSAIFAVPNVTFICLQYGPVDEALARAAVQHGVQIHRDPEVDASNDIDALTAQIAAMDLVISVSNTTVHLAGALGVPVWTLTPTGAGRLWYWFDGLEHSPWYPSMRLYQQTEPGNWEAVMGPVARDLLAWSTKQRA